MQGKKIIYEYVYTDFLIRLCEGEFPLGAAIPSLTELCAEYKVGKNTVSKALQLLKENGFLELSQGKVGRVRFDCEHLEQYLHKTPGFLSDKTILLDYFQAIKLLFPTLYTYASLSCKKEQLEELQKIIMNLHSCSADNKLLIRTSALLSRTILSSVDNSLLKNVVQTTMQTTMLPTLLLIGHHEIFAPILSQIAQRIDPLYTALLQKNEIQLKACWTSILSIYQQILEKSLRLGIFPDPPLRQEKYLFQATENEKSFLVASSLRHKILCGTYTTGDLLPSIAKAKTLYCVSAITTRRAYQILAEMGFVQTINGRGTEVLPPSSGKNSPLPAQTALQKKKLYQEAVAFLEISCEDIVSAARHISFSRLQENLNSPWNANRRHSVFILIYSLFQGTASPAIFSIYAALGNGLYWECHLDDIPATKELCNTNHQKCLKILASLERLDFVAASTELQKLLKTLYPSK